MKPTDDEIAQFRRDHDNWLRSNGEELPAEYGQRRANETRCMYFTTRMGHTMVRHPINLRNVKDYGGVERFYRPQRVKNRVAEVTHPVTSEV